MQTVQPTHLALAHQEEVDKGCHATLFMQHYPLFLGFLGEENACKVDLPENAINVSQLIAKSCIAKRQETGRFYITGIGGLPTHPEQIIEAQGVKIVRYF